MSKKAIYFRQEENLSGSFGRKDWDFDPNSGTMEKEETSI